MYSTYQAKLNQHIENSEKAKIMTVISTIYTWQMYLYCTRLVLHICLNGALYFAEFKCFD